MIRLGTPCTFIEAKKQETDRLRLPSLREAVKLEGIQGARETPLWTRSIVAYPKANHPFSFEITFSNHPFEYSIDTKLFQGKRRIALLFEDFDLRVNGRAVTYAPHAIKVLENFPQESGWYARHESGVPVMNGAKDLFLWRDDEARVGPAVLLVGDSYRNNVFLHHRHSKRFTPVFLPNEAEASKGAKQHQTPSHN